MSIEPPPKSTITLHHSFACAADGEHQGGIVGCCHICGQLLCEAHIYYLPNSPLFGEVSADELAVLPLTCKTHAGEDRRRGLPGETQRQTTRSQKIIRRPKPKGPKPTGRRI